MILRSLIAVISVAVIFLGSIPYLLISSGLGLTLPASSIGLIGILPVLVGAVILLWCAWNFGSVGRGTPAPFDPPKALVTRGLYRTVRNPMYIGAELVLIGEAIILGSLTIVVYALLLLSVFHIFTVYYEEPTLKRKFGKAYEQYCQEVPRWVPQLRRAKN